MCSKWRRTFCQSYEKEKIMRPWWPWLPVLHGCSWTYVTFERKIFMKLTKDSLSAAVKLLVFYIHENMLLLFTKVNEKSTQYTLKNAIWAADPVSIKICIHTNWRLGNNLIPVSPLKTQRLVMLQASPTTISTMHHVNLLTRTKILFPSVLLDE